MKHLVVFLFSVLVLCQQRSVAQYKEYADSLLLLLKTVKHDSTKARIYSQLTEVCEIQEITKYCDEIFKISKRYENSKDIKERNTFLSYKATAINNLAFVADAEGNVDKCITLYKDALSIREQIKDTNAVGNTLYNLAVLYKGVGKTNEAFSLFQKALKYLELKRNYEGVIRTLHSIGAYYLEKGQIIKAIEYFEKSLRVSKEHNILTGVTEALTGLGFVYGELGDLNKEQDYLEECLPIQKEMEDYHGLTYTYNNLGYVNIQKKKYDVAKSYYYKSLQCANKTLEQESIALAYHNIGNSFRLQRNIDSALFYFEKSIGLRNQIKDDGGKSLTLIELGSVYLGLNNLPKAKKCYEEAYGIGEKLDLSETKRKASHVLSDLYAQEGNFKEAYKMHALYKTYSDSLYNQENRKAVYKQQIKLDYEKKEQEIKLISKLENEKIQTIANEEKRRQNLVIYFVTCCLVLVFVIALFIFKNYRQKQRANIILEEKNALIERQKEKVELQKEIIQEKQKEVLDSIHYAKRIQNTLLAHHEFLDENLPDNFVFFKPKDIVSGDFYWATKHGDNFYIAVCDSTGHGVPGAFMSLLNIGFLNEAINEKDILEPDEIFNHVRKRLIKSISKDGQKDGFDGILLRINQKTKEMTYAAAHNAPILILGTEIIELEKDKMPVGVGEGEHAFKLYRIEATRNDMLYLYTDGYADQFGGPKGKKFKYKPLNELLLSISSQPLKHQKEVLNETFNNWRGDLEQVDDVCVIGIRL